MKRLFDLGLLLLTFPVWLPLLCLVGVAVWITLGRPILFHQPRPGLNGEIFILRKFRTMTTARDALGKVLPDAERLTAFGRWLRSTSLDELPEILNVLEGDLSLVGPRPLLVRYLARYTPEQARRHEVRPGLTGWAQVHGRNALGWEERFRLDVWYVDHRSLWLDMRILAMTVIQVLRREGITEVGEATKGEFMGSMSNHNGPEQGVGYDVP